MTTINKIASSGLFQNLAKKGNQACSAIGSAFSKAAEKGNGNNFISKVTNAVEPTGANNSFIALAALMIGTVIIPRVKTAAKRNPDNKEATKDEIIEILFRDCQTVLIILFALKAASSVISALSTKYKGLPMVNKQFEQLFETNEKGLKGIAERGKELIQHPLKKLKTMGKNLLNALHPTQGVRTLTDKEFIKKYSGYSSIEEVKKLLDSLPSQGGNSEKVFERIMDSLIKGQDALINGSTKANSKAQEGLIKKGLRMANLDGSAPKTLEEGLKNAEEIKKLLENLKNQGYKNIDITNLDERAKNLIVDFFKNQDGALVQEAKGLSAILRTIALAVEVIYLGFGLPALNQLRLERKYLKNNPTQGKKAAKKQPEKTLINKTVRPQEIKIFHKFLK